MKKTLKKFAYLEFSPYLCNRNKEINNQTKTTNIMEATNNNQFNVQVINASFLNVIRNVRKGTFAMISYHSTEKLPKYLGFSGEVTKVTNGVIQLNYSYESAVNNHIEKNGGERTFEAQSLPWGHWFIDNLVIEHNGKLYLRAYVQGGSNGLKTQYFVDGKEATEEQVQTITEYKNKRNGSNAQAQHGLEEGQQVKPFNVAVENIIALTCGECKYNKLEAVKQAQAEALAG